MAEFFTLNSVRTWTKPDPAGWLHLTTDNCQFCSWSADSTGLHTLRCLQVCRLCRPANSTPYYRWLPVLQVYRLYRSTDSTGLQTLQVYRLYRSTDSTGLQTLQVYRLYRSTGLQTLPLTTDDCQFYSLYKKSLGLLMKNFTLKEMDNELHSMALICSLPDEYKSLSQSLILHDNLNLNKNKIRKAFLAETNSQRRGEQSIAGMSDIALSSSCCNHSSHSLEECDFCGLKGHTLSQCHKLIAACAYACRPHNPKKWTANTANTANIEPEASNIVKSAGNASSCHKSSSPL